jgi:hypothetical protein
MGGIHLTTLRYRTSVHRFVRKRVPEPACVACLRCSLLCSDVKATFYEGRNRLGHTCKYSSSSFFTLLFALVRSICGTCLREEDPDTGEGTTEGVEAEAPKPGGSSGVMHLMPRCSHKALSIMDPLYIITLILSNLFKRVSWHEAAGVTIFWSALLLYTARQERTSSALTLMFKYRRLRSSRPGDSWEIISRKVNHSE